MNLKFWEKKEEYNQTTNISTFKMAMNTAFDSETVDLSQPFIRARAGQDFIPFGVDNLYPYNLLELYHKSPFHSAVMEYKASLLLKEDLIYLSESKSDLENKIQIEKLKLKFNKDFLYSFILEYLIHHRVSLDIKDKSITRIIPAEEIRFNQDMSLYTIVDDWRISRVKEEKKAYQHKTGTGVLTYQRLTKGFKYYAIPTYSKASNWMYLDGEMSLFQKQNINNSINPSAIIKIYQTFDNEEKKKKFIDGLTHAFAGARNAGKALVLTAKSKELAPDIEIADANKLDKAFVAVQESIIKNISYAHLTNPSLMGISTGGKLGATQELQDAFKLFKISTLIPLMEVLEDYLTNLAQTVYGYKGKIKFNREINLL